MGSLYSTTFILLSADGLPTDGYIRIEKLPQRGNEEVLGRARYADDESAEDFCLWFSEDDRHTLVAGVNPRHCQQDNRDGNAPFTIKMVFENREVVALKVTLLG